MNFDVVIIGASSSGLYAADLLVCAGKSVAVFERQVSLKPARRTYIITPHIRSFISEIPGDETLCHTRVMAVESKNSTVDIAFQQPDLIIERSLLTQRLLNRAKAHGVEIFFGHRFLRFQEGSQTQLLFQTEDGEVRITADYVIGADGYNSVTAEAAGIHHPPVVPIVQAEVTLPEGWNAEITKVWFDVADTKYFYWLIPESSERGVLGLVGEDARETRERLDNFLEKQNLKAIRYQASQVAMHHPGLRPWAKVGSIPVYLVGDAAGQVKVTTVGGTVTGFWGAKAATDAIINGTSYRKELRSLKLELDLHWFIRLMLERLDDDGYDRLVRCITPNVQDFLSKRNRDQMVGGFWKLPFKEPRLLLLGIRLIFRK